MHVLKDYGIGPWCTNTRVVEQLNNYNYFIRAVLRRTYEIMFDV